MDKSSNDKTPNSLFGTTSVSSSDKIPNSLFGTTSSSTKNESNVPSVKEALNEYFNLKLKYETQIMLNKKKILNNKTLSNREKRAEYLKLKPKCIHCRRPGGTIFKVVYQPATDKEDSYRQYLATCGIIAEPCNLNIKIELGKVEPLPVILNSMQKDIKNYKDKIIDDKNKLLFGYITTEEALQNFEKIKEDISFYTSLYEFYLVYYNEIVDNDNKKRELNEAVTNSYIQIEEIKSCISKMKDTDNVQYARDAVNIYNNTLTPLLNSIRALRYNETNVWHNEDTNTCDLIQTQYSIQNLSFSSFIDKVAAYEIGVDVKFTKKVAVEEAPQISKEVRPMSDEEPGWVR
jgi:hypothetical protein